jgi:hypothetical protein
VRATGTNGSGTSGEGVFLSLNEIETTVLKAARGAGYGWGLAEEAGAAARWLAQHDLPWAATLGILFAENTVRLLGTDRVMSNPLVAGTWICDDFAVDTGTPLNLPAVIAPLWLAAVVGVGGRGKPVDVVMEWPQAALGTLRGELQHAAGDLANPGPAPVCIRTRHPVGEAVVVARTPLHGGRRVDEAVWRLLVEYEKRTYVPASLHSREMGAGAGTSDND